MQSFHSTATAYGRLPWHTACSPIFFFGNAMSTLFAGNKPIAVASRSFHSVFSFRYFLTPCLPFSLPGPFLDIFLYLLLDHIFILYSTVPRSRYAYSNTLFGPTSAGSSRRDSVQFRPWQTAQFSVRWRERTSHRQISTHRWLTQRLHSLLCTSVTLVQLF